MTKKSQLKPVKRTQSPSNSRATGPTPDATDSAESPQRLSKRILKPLSPISKLRILENFDSFYSGGEIQFIGSDSRFFSIFNDRVRVYSTKTYRLAFEIEHKNEEVHNFVTFERNSTRFVITFTKNGMVRLLRLFAEETDGKWFEVLEKKKTLRFLAVEMRIDSSGKYLIMADPKGDFKIVNAQTLRVIREFNLGSGYVKMRIVGQYIAFISRERALVLYNILTNKKVRHVTAESVVSFSDFAVLSVAGKQLLLTGFDNQVYFFDAKADALSPVHQLDGFANIIETISFGEDKSNTLCILGLEDGRLQLFWFNAQTRQLAPVIVDRLFKNRHPFQRILFDYPRSEVYFVTDEGEIYKTKLSIAEGQVRIELLEEFIGLNDQIMDLRFINSEFGVVCTNSETVRVVNLKTRSSKLLSSHEDIVTCVDVYKERYMLTGSKDGRVHLWRIVRPGEEADLGADALEKLEFNRSADSDFGVNFRLVKRYKGHTRGVTTVRFAPKTGTKFVSAGADGMIKLWDLKAKTCKTVRPHTSELNFVRISNNEKLILTGSHDRHINFYNASDLSLITQVPAHKRGVWDADFAPFERLVASASSDQTVKIWNYEDLSKVEQVGVLEGSTAPVLKVRWIVNGLQLISGSADGVIKIWNARKKICVATFDSHDGRIWSMDVLETGIDRTMVFSGDNNNRLLLWEDVTQETEDQRLLEQQQNATALDHFTSFLRKKDFMSAAKFAFERSMPASFFDALTSCRAELLHKTERIYELEEDAIDSSTEDEKSTPDFESVLLELVPQLWSVDKKRLLILVKNFVTHSRYSIIVQCLLKALLRHIKLSQLAELTEELKSENIDLQQLLEVYKTFSERHLAAVRRNLKLAHSYALFTEKHKELIN